MAVMKSIWVRDEEEEKAIEEAVKSETERRKPEAEDERGN